MFLDRTSIQGALMGHGPRAAARLFPFWFGTSPSRKVLVETPGHPLLVISWHWVLGTGGALPATGLAITWHWVLGPVGRCPRPVRRSPGTGC